MTFPTPARSRLRPTFRSPVRTSRHPLRWLCRLTAGAVTAGLVATAAPALADDDLPAGRKVVSHTVRSGDTATELAVKYHAWTAELISLNDLGPSAALQVGDRIRIPVVLAALPKGERPKAGKSTSGTHETKHAKKAGKPARATPRKSTARPAHPSRAKVRDIIERTARNHGVDPHLALAVSWQESGWQMHHVSSADAIGAMQVLPDTGEWMSLYAGRPLKLRHTHDNVLAGVLLLDLLDDMTKTRRQQVGAYYQGLGAVREHGLYGETKAYVDNVQAIQRRLEKSGNP
ncbi:MULTISPECIES: lytic transglycosylase domain-containing protein [unclassified Nocardioides]|uniref:lytic transglycosylase domain-containing protein n=1 Tax=unclassified Nocardioides TaxID=2615069 RepID=UPI0006F25DDB|nr:MULTISPECIES: lytic transglycosylase domain-containing protein [unclassified Nocardioides]KQY63954.1 hypothetical protein ASD30_02955 [Nocardioides sp. Root140]KRF15968.1 hypothetical protein ASH02_04960 [Nocardioides sp. Soil796]